MARRKKASRIVLWLLAAGGGVFLYYGITTAWGLFRVGSERARLERECLHLRARTLALEARREALKDPKILKMIAERRLGMEPTDSGEPGP